MVNRTTKEIVMTKKFLIAAAFVGAMVSGSSAFAGEQCTKAFDAGSVVTMTCWYDDGSFRNTSINKLMKTLDIEIYPSVGATPSATIHVDVSSGMCHVQTYKPPMVAYGHYDPSYGCRLQGE
jgi:hypothetical protein